MAPCPVDLDQRNTLAAIDDIRQGRPGDPQTEADTLKNVDDCVRRGGWSHNA
jgi:hypothetical protein